VGECRIESTFDASLWLSDTPRGKLLRVRWVCGGGLLYFEIDSSSVNSHAVGREMDIHLREIADWGNKN
jgi:hypothetical protein